ncbi:peptide deformylase [Clostridia bacterium]|nr:peptide deformylase [Clostridia bacterium]
MALRQLVRFDDDNFRKISRPVEKFDKRLWALLDDMYDTLKNVGGYGMTAAHIGILRRAVVIDDENGRIELINPAITTKSEQTQRVFEGSIAGGAPWGYVIRPLEVSVSAADRFGNPVTQDGNGFLAATLYHEIDQLDGVRFTDKADEIITDPVEVNKIIKQQRKG